MPDDRTAADQIVYSSWRHEVLRKDGDLIFLTDNQVLLENLRDELPVLCEQKKAEKCIPGESNFIEANKLGFGDDIGAITNRITAMTELQSLFEPGSAEYEVLEYRITAGQHAQQCAVDALKGIVAKPMPKHWYELKAAQATGNPVDVAICADKKPYFMMYRYDELRSDYKKFDRAVRFKCLATTEKKLDVLLADIPENEDEQWFVNEYRRLCPVSISNGVVNRICKLCEAYFSKHKNKKTEEKIEFDSSILKSGVSYNRGVKDRIKELFKEYTQELQKMAQDKTNEEDKHLQKEATKEAYLMRCMEVCPDPVTLCDAVVDACYAIEKSKQFAWDMCGEQIIKNLLSHNGNKFVYPCRDNDGDIIFQGRKYGLREVRLSDCGVDCDE